MWSGAPLAEDWGLGNWQPPEESELLSATGRGTCDLISWALVGRLYPGLSKGPGENQHLCGSWLAGGACTFI